MKPPDPLEDTEEVFAMIAVMGINNLSWMIQNGMICPEGINFSDMLNEDETYYQCILRPVVDFIEVMLDFCGPDLLDYTKSEYSVIRKLTKVDQDRIRKKLRVVPPLVNFCRFVIRKTIVKAAPSKNINSHIEKIKSIPGHLKKNFLNYGDFQEAST